jgi:exosortase
LRAGRFILSPMSFPAAQSRSRALPWTVFFLLAAWIWAIWSCAEHWQGNPNYSYGWAVPLLVVGFAFRRYFRLNPNELRESKSADLMSIFPGAAIVLVASAVGFILEYARDQMWHQEIVLWAICLLAVGSTIAVLSWRAGAAVARAELFPVLFFLTAVPWPPRFEQPIVSHLMTWVALATTELLHWFGIEAQTSGAAIALPAGLVGISEACSGVRSLQAGIMFGLAMGEWFLLRPWRRVILVVIAVALALITNLARTLALSLQAEWHGVDSIERVHDLIGNIVITALIVTIWLAGKFLASSRGPTLSVLSVEQITERLKTVASKLTMPSPKLFRALTLTLLVGIIGARSLYAWIEAKDRTQTTPLFEAKIDNSNQLRRIPQEIWNELRPTTGEYIHRQSSELPGGSADCFHFFWKPSPWNRFALVHRPDICMPGVGWQLIGSAEPIEVVLNGNSIRCHLFRFKRGETYALELWGVWRNGEPIALDYEPNQALGAALPPSSLHLEGKRRSATEIVACSVIANGESPSPQIALALFRSVFDYRGHE